MEYFLLSFSSNEYPFYLVQLKALKDAIEADYFFEMLIDELPMWGYIGEVVHEEFLLGKSIQGARVYLYPHLHFSIGYNGDQIVTANVTTDACRRVDITDVNSGQEVSLKIEVWYWTFADSHRSINYRSYFLTPLNGFTPQKLITMTA